MSKIWYKAYQEGVPQEIDPSQYANLTQLFDEVFAKFRQLPAFTNMGCTLSFTDLERLSRHFMSYLQHIMNLQKGDKIALMMPNILTYPVALFGALRAGLTVVNVNPLYTDRELKHQLCDSGAKAIVIFEGSLSVLEKVLAQTPIKHIIRTSIGELFPVPKKWIVDAVVKYRKKLIPAHGLSETTPFSVAIKRGAKFVPKMVELNHTDLAFLQYTGGTTGVAKGAMLSHKNIIANIMQARAWLAPKCTEGEELVVTPLPLYHIFSLTANCFAMSSFGGHNLLITNPRDMKGFIAEMNRYPFTILTGVNTLFNGLLNHPDFEKLNFANFNFTLGGGMAVQEAVAVRWQKVTGVPLIEAYGLTETSPAACINPLNLDKYNHKIGVPISSTEVAIMNDEGDHLPCGEVGEICIRGPQVMEGYWQRPDETEKVMTKDNYFRTGDLGFMDAQGYVQIVDRKKDMILVSGFNVYPNEVEEVAMLCEKVLECAAVGVPDEKSGEAVKLVVVKRDPSLTEKELIDFCNEKLTNYKRPKIVEFRTDLPKSNVGKILRKELRPRSS